VQVRLNASKLIKRHVLVTEWDGRLVQKAADLTKQVARGSGERVKVSPDISEQRLEVP
jgi:hypothetical protein